MGYKNSSEFGSILPKISSGTPSRKMKTNADIFEERGMPWNTSLPPRTPALSPEGKLRVNQDAHLYNLTHKQETVPHGDQTEDLSFSTQHCLPINVRLAKERNTLMKSMNTDSKPSSIRMSVASKAAARLRSKRASSFVKVK